MSEQHSEPSMSDRIRILSGHAPAQQADGGTDEDEQQTQRTDFDGGVRTNVPLPPDMDTTIRRAAGVIR